MTGDKLSPAEVIAREALDRYAEAVNRNTYTGETAIAMVRAGEQLVQEIRRACREDFTDRLIKAGVL